MTNAQKRNRDFDNIFDSYNQIKEQKIDFLREHGVPENELAELAANTGLGADALGKKIASMGYSIADAIQPRNSPVKEWKPKEEKAKTKENIDR